MKVICTYFGHLNNVQQECEHLTFMLEVNRPRDKGPMVGRCPSIGRKVKAPRIVLLIISGAWKGVCDCDWHVP